MMSDNNSPNWVNLFEKNGGNDTETKISVLTKISPTKGNMAYEYNPFYNYRIQQNMYEYDGNLYTLYELWQRYKILPNCFIDEYFKVDKTKFDKTETAKNIEKAFEPGNNRSRQILEKNLENEGIKSWTINGKELTDKSSPILRQPGELTDFITDELKFDLAHPVQILPQYSYDGSVNLILNDGLNTPKLINSRFSATGKNTYEVCDRKGNNDTNIYDQGESFNLDTSLYKGTTSIVKLQFKGVESGGALKIGNYHFYFKLSDADGNESDFVAESGVVSIFLGQGSYFSVTTGERDEVAYKQVLFQLSNIDTSYDYVHVYYSRYTAENDQNRIIEYRKIEKDYLINQARVSNIIISGNEVTSNISAEDINLQFNVVDSACTSAICQNMLFLANVHKPDIPYTELQDLSLRILPYLHEETYKGDVNHTYGGNTELGYIDPNFIYEKTGYWTGELYRFGIVYIMPDNTLSPVFNIRGGCSIGVTSDVYTKYDVYDDDGNRIYIPVQEDNFQLIKGKNQSQEETNQSQAGSCYFENSKGVVQFVSSRDTNIIFSVDILIPEDVKKELSKYVKGYFFVRQPRIPFVLAQGITIGIDKESGLPTIPTKGGVVDSVSSLDLSTTHVNVGYSGKIDEVVYLSEGFLSRYSFGTKKKSSAIWKDVGKWLGLAIAAAAAAVATCFTFGVAAPTLGIVAGAIVGAALVGSTLAGTIDEAVLAFNRIGGVTYNRWNSDIPDGYEIVENDKSRLLTHDYADRIILTALDQNNINGIISPEYETNQPYFNSIFIGNEHLIESTKTQGINILNQYGDNYFNNNDRHFYIPGYTDFTFKRSRYANVVSVPDDRKIVCLGDLRFRSRAGDAEEAFRYECIGNSYKTNAAITTGVDDEETTDHRKINSDIVRGSYGPYLAFDDNSNYFRAAEIVNIYTPGYQHNKLEEYVYQRCCDNSTFHTISDRFELSFKEKTTLQDDQNNGTIHHVYRGDCYLCQFTHRVNRNFQSPSAPLNDMIIQPDTWKDNYEPGGGDVDRINLSDVNAVQLGTWITFKVRASSNLNIRTQDTSNASEWSMTGTPRTYYPKTPMSVDGTYKIPESFAYNAGFRKTLSERYNFEVPDVPWLKNWYKTRIMYSNINVSDSFQNGFRIFKGQNYRDYTREYGEITKIVSFESSILCVFEHGIALIPVNERAVAAEGRGGFAYINTSNVLPENPKIISDVYGSQWADSILKVPGKFGNNIQYVYGVDTVAKKIWRTDGNSLTCISDFKVQEFLNNNITLSERELTPKLGIRNVKTFYNAFKRDVLFTFYDNTYGFEEKVWNLCWNELLNQFVTFYSWVPSNMENINNIPFSFNRNTVKWISKLGISHSDNSFADGITLSNVVIPNEADVVIPSGTQDLNTKYLRYLDSNITQVSYEGTNGNTITKEVTISDSSMDKLIGVLSLSNRTIPYLDAQPKITYSIERDIWGNWDKFEIKKIILNQQETSINDTGDFIIEPDGKYTGKTISLYGLYFKDNHTPQDLMSEIYYRNKAGHVYADKKDNKYTEIPTNPKSEDFNIKWKELLTRTIGDKKYMDLPIYKDSKGKRLTLENPYNKDRIVTMLNIKANIDYQVDDKDGNLSDAHYNGKANIANIDAGYYQSTVAIIPKWNLQFLSTDFWKHGQSGIFDIADKIYPTYWYGEQHPFEFEFVVASDGGKHKIFDNLQIISNKAEPESFHYEIVGECYDFAKDKENMYIRQEATKELYQFNGFDIAYDHDYSELESKHRQSEDKDFVKSTIFPLNYYKQDHVNEVYHSYLGKNDTVVQDDSYTLAGAELILYKNLNELRIVNHSKALDAANPEIGLRHGNMRYKEDLWHIQIDPLNFIQSNEPDWKDTQSIELIDQSKNLAGNSEPNSNTIPINLDRFGLYDSNKSIEVLKFPNNDNFKNRGYITWNNISEEQAKLKDKYIKIRVRYSGKDLAIINAINTLYTISYS